MIPDPFIRARDGADAVREGFFLVIGARRQRVDMPVRIWFGPPTDEDGFELDRSPRWQIALCGMVLDEPVTLGGLRIETLSDIWPACAAHEITRDEYDYRIARQSWAAAHDPLDPFGTPGGRIDPMTAPLPFL